MLFSINSGNFPYFCSLLFYQKDDLCNHWTLNSSWYVLRVKTVRDWQLPWRKFWRNMMLPFWILARQIFTILFRWAFCARRKNNTRGSLWRNCFSRLPPWEWLSVSTPLLPKSTRIGWICRDRTAIFLLYWGVSCLPVKYLPLPVFLQSKVWISMPSSALQDVSRWTNANRVHAPASNFPFVALRKTVLPCKNS